MKKRILSMLLVFVMLASLLPANVLTAFAAAADPVWVGGVAMYDGDYLAVGATATLTTKPSGGYAYYKDGTLTLNNYSYTGIGYFYYENEVTRRAIIYTSNAIQIELVGTNNLTQEKYNNLTGQKYVNTACISGDASVSLTGAGTLNLQNAIWGIKCKSYLSIESGNLNVDACEYGVYSWDQEVIINGGSLKIDATKCAVCGERGIEINGGSGIFRNTQDSIFRVLHSNGTVTIDPSLVVMASTTAYGELGEYVAANLASYKKIVTMINNVNVSATFSGTPANATSNTNGITVTSTKWYKKNGSSWTELGASDTIKEGGSYRCEVTVAEDGCQLADGYTVKINGIAATKKSGNTWYRDVTITGYTSYVDVYDIALPEAGAKPDFTFNDVECRYSSVALVEWFECDKDGKKLSGALSADYKFKEDSYYRLEVTVVPDANYKFDTRDLDFYIGGKAAQYYYPYQNTTYPDSVTGWKVYHVDDANGTYTIQIGDITLKDGDYLANNATAVTTVKPVGGYAGYKDGVLTLNNFVAAKLVRYYERYLEVELIGENKIGAIADYYYWDTTSNDYFTGLEFRGTGNLEFDVYYDHPYCNVSVNGDVIFNGSGDILLDAEYYCFKYTDNVIINDGYVYCYTSQDSVFGDDTIIEVNGGKLQMFDGGCWDKFLCNGTLTIAAGSVYVSDDPRKIELEDCVPWDGVTDLNTYDNVWIVTEEEDTGALIGDVNGDGLVNAKDALLLRKSIAAGNASSLDLKVADVNGDGVINAKDVVKLRRKVTGGYN